MKNQQNVPGKAKKALYLAREPGNEGSIIA
jgi:hypothetical protein